MSEGARLKEQVGFGESAMMICGQFPTQAVGLTLAGINLSVVPSLPCRVLPSLWSSPLSALTYRLKKQEWSSPVVE